MTLAKKDNTTIWVIVAIASVASFIVGMVDEIGIVAKVFALLWIIYGLAGLLETWCNKNYSRNDISGRTEIGCK